MPSKAGAIRAGRAYVEAFLDRTELEKGIKKAQARLNAFARKVGAIGGTLIATGASILAPMTAAIKLFASAGDQLDKMSKRTGFAVETLSALDFAASQSGASIEQLDKSLAAMARFSLQADRGLATAVDLLDMLGISVEELQSLSPEQRFLRMASAIGAVPDETRRAGIALAVFGRSGRELLPMLAQGEAGIQKLMERAKELGIVMSTEDATAAAEITDALDELTRSAKMAVFTLGGALVPEAKELTNQLVEMLPELKEWIAENSDLIHQLAELALGLIAVGGALLAVATVSKIAAAGIGLVTGALTFLMAHPLAILIVGIAVGLAALAKEAIEASDGMKQLNRELERSTKLEEELAAIRDKSNQAVLDRVKNTENLKERRRLLEQEIELAEKNKQGQENQLKLARGQHADARSGVFNKVRDLLGINANASASRQQGAEVRANLQSTTDQLKALRDELKLLDEQESKFGMRAEEDVKGINKILAQMTDELETFGLDSAQKAIRELRELNASEEELAQARQLSAAIARKEAAEESRKQREKDLERARQEAERASEAIADQLQGLADTVSDLRLDPAEHGKASTLRDLRRQGASGEQLDLAARLLDLQQRMSETETRMFQTNSPLEVGTREALQSFLQATQGKQTDAAITAKSSAEILELLKELKTLREREERQKQRKIVIGRPN